MPAQDDGGKIGIRNVDPDVWRRVKAAAVEMNVPLGQLVTEIFKQWLQTRAKGRP